LVLENPATHYSVMLPPRYSFKLPHSMKGSATGKFEELSSIIHAEGVRGCCTTSNLRVDGDSLGMPF
jgi:hypothetical protein